MAALVLWCRGWRPVKFFGRGRWWQKPSGNQKRIESINHV